MLQQEDISINKQVVVHTHTGPSHKLHVKGKGTALIGTDNKEAKLATVDFGEKFLGWGSVLWTSTPSYI
jgi:hypothetical protein